MKYEIVVGLEVHAELNTKTKIYCGCKNSFGSMVNSNCCPICTGMPGTLPTLNKSVVDYAVRMGYALHCSINNICKMDRKNYFYPDLPKAYQISQFDIPLCENGYIDAIVDEEGHTKRIGVTRIHIEEDAGKLIHSDDFAGSLVDFNRCGVPLIEIVSEPDMRSAEEVIAYLEKLRLIIQYLGASDCKLNEGSMRADVNLSVREVGAEKFGTRTEMKNLNSFKAIARAIENEKERQIDLIESGEKVIQETRRWDDTKEYSYAMRSKEDAQDYRYFPDPDLVPVMISDEWMEEIRSRQPELRDEKRIRYKEEYDIPDYDIDILTNSKKLADIFEEAIALGAAPKKVSNWLMVETMRLMKEASIDADDLKFSAKNLAAIIKMVDDKVINGTVAKEVFEKVFAEDIDPEAYVEEHGLKTVNDEGALRTVILDVIEKNPKSVADFKGGKEKAIGALVGQTMKAMQGKADPSEVNRILREELSK